MILNLLGATALLGTLVADFLNKQLSLRCVMNGKSSISTLYTVVGGLF